MNVNYMDKYDDLYIMEESSVIHGGLPKCVTIVAMELGLFCIPGGPFVQKKCSFIREDKTALKNLKHQNVRTFKNLKKYQMI